MRLVLKTLLASWLLVLGSYSWADCACFCADGKEMTMCSTIEEAQANTNKCFVGETSVCPTLTGDVSTSSYEAPGDDATNCRDVTVWESNTFTIVKACNVLPAS